MRSQSYFNRLFLVALAACCCFLSVHAQFHDGSNVTFGKNRVQYQDFNWQYFPSQGVEVYYYQGGKALASRVVSEWPSLTQEVERIMDRNLEYPIQIIVFNKQEEFRQSNIGGSSTEDVNIGGTALLVGSKIFLYGRGENELLRQDIKRGLAELIFNQTMYGGQWKEALRNSTLISFPPWFTEGLYSYISNPWSTEIAMHVQDAARCHLITGAQRAPDLIAPWAGHAVWKYVADVMGEAVIANVLYMARVSRSMEKGFQYATGMDMSTLLLEVSQYHLGGEANPVMFPALSSAKDLRKAAKNGGDFPIPLKRHLNYRQVSLHPNGQVCAVVTEERGQIKIWHCELASGKMTLLGKHGHKIDRVQDDTYPVLAWHPNGTILTYTLEEQSRNFLINVDINTLNTERKEVFRIDKILSMAYAPDGRTMIWSGLLNGQTDLFRYQVLSNNHLPLWSDAFDDLNPLFSPDGKTIWFTSNRTSTAMPCVHVLGNALPKAHDIFALNWDAEIPELLRWVDSPNLDERLPQLQSDAQLTYLVEHSDGSQERWVSWRDSAIASIDTTIHYRWFTETRLAEKYEVPVLSIETSPAHRVIAQTTRLNGHLFWKLEEKETRELSVANVEGRLFAASDDIELDWDWEPDPTEADFRDYTFGPWQARDAIAHDLTTEPVAQSSTPLDGPTESTNVFKLPKPRNYRLNYAIEAITGQLDNSFGSNFYQAYTGAPSVQPGLGGLTKITMSDLFEDRRFSAGFRLSGSLENSRYALAYSDLSHRLDKTWVIERQGTIQTSNNNQTFTKSHIHLLRRQWAYPLDDVRSIRVQGIARLDRNTPLATDANQLESPTTYGLQGGVEVAYVFDNSRERNINIREGTRYRVWLEYLVNPLATNTTFGTVGFDFRHYERLFHDVTFAVRAAADWSVGSQRLLHFLGGVDNQLSLNQTPYSPVDPNIPYAYQTRITPLRGFSTNARNGSHMAVINAELRVPVWSTITSQSVESDFMQHLQCIGFADIGSAWNGLHPYDESNTFNQVTVTQNPITVTIDNNREPIIWGTGFGVRSRLLGYWVRADWCWGVDDGRWQKRIFALSLHLDF